MATNQTPDPAPERTDYAAYKDPDHPGNSSKHRTGRPCIETGCNEPAGTAWGPHWCMKHNIERIDRITQSLEELVERAPEHE